jgi:hypothetical protein
MGRYHFNVRNGTGYTRDDEGQELSDLDQVRRKAVEGARSLLSAEALTGDLDLRGRIEVTDERGEIVITVAFRDAIDVKTGELPFPGGERQIRS